MVKTKVYVEGGGRKALDRECRKAFAAFLSKAGFPQGTVEIEACGPRGEAFRTFSADLRKGSPAILLVDAEGPVATRSTWQHLKSNDNWVRPSGATDDQCHLMVQIMESWFLADIKTLESYFGTGFRSQLLPGNPNVEDVPKQDVLDGLERATGGTASRYNKGTHSFTILGMLDPEKVKKLSPHANRFIESLTK